MSSELSPYLGRFFHSSDERGPGSAPYIVLSYAYWQNHFPDDPGVVGRTILLNKYPFTVLGVAPPQFRGTALFFAADLWVPLANQAQVAGVSTLDARNVRNLWLVGRIRPGVSRGQLTGDLDSIAASLARTYPKEDDGMSFALTRPELMGDFIGQPARGFLAGLMLLAGLILLAACANLGSLFAARAADRAREVALRLALGSSRGRIMRQLLTEAIMISLAGGLVGLAGSVLLLPWLSSWQPLPQFPINMPVNPDASVYAVALLLALLSGLLFGLVPVRQVLATNPYQVIKSGVTRVSRRFTLRDVLLVGQIAICAVLVTSSLVAVRGLLRSLHSNFGFQAENTMLVDLDLAMARYSGEQQPVLQRRLLDAVRAISGVTAAAYANTVPLNLDQLHSNVFADGATDLRASKAVAQTVEFAVSPGYFDAAGTTLLAGRSFTWHDDQAAPQVAISWIREFARQVFGSTEKAIGGHYTNRARKRIEVVGVAEDGKYMGLTEDPQAAMFYPMLQAPSSNTWLVVRWNRDPQQLAAALRKSIRGIDAGLPFTIRSWYNELDSVLFPSRVATLSLGVLGALGAMLALTGIFGMAAYSVSKRLREFGIRIALGARGNELLRVALGRVLRLLAFGSAAGVLLGLAAGKLLAFIVYQATPRDPLVLAGVLLTMLRCRRAAGRLDSGTPRAGRGATFDPAARGVTAPRSLLRQ